MKCPKCGASADSPDPLCETCHKMADFFKQYAASYSLSEDDFPSGDAMDWTVEHALQYALYLLREHKVFKNGEPTKCYIIFLNDEDNNYGTREINSGLLRSNIVQLLEIMKYRVIYDLHKTDDDE